MLIALVVVLIWFAVVALILRPFGVSLPLGPFRYTKRRDALQSLNFAQYGFVNGVLHFGCGMLIATTLYRYLDWKYWHSRPNFLTAGEFFGNALLWLILGGIVFGLMSYGTSARSPK
jgi:hypothetical protein